MARKSQKDVILDAAETVIARQGLAGATIDAIAAEAGVSKGGLFYHFVSKKELLLQLIDRYEQRFYEKRLAVMDQLPDTPGRLLKATILASLDTPARDTHKASNLISLLDDADFRDKITSLKKRTFEEVVRGSPHPERIALAMLAADGLWVAELFGRPVVTDKFRGRVIEALMETIDHFSEEMAETVPSRGGRGGKKRSGED